MSSSIYAITKYIGASNSNYLFEIYKGITTDKIWIEIEENEERARMPITEQELRDLANRINEFLSKEK